MDRRTKIRIYLWLHVFVVRTVVCLCLLYLTYKYRMSKRRRRPITTWKKWSLISKIPQQVKHMMELVEISDQTCINNLRMDRNAFLRLCYLLENLGGLHDERFVTVSEKVACFLLILAHHTKNVVVKHNFNRSGHTISKYFNQTLRAVIKISALLLVEPHPVGDDCNIEPWRYFKGCLGALDGTYVEVRVCQSDQGRYRCRKGMMAVNVLGVCNRDLNFVYVLAGWEGSAADSRVLRDALHRPHGLRVPAGCYYLCDAGYSNSEGFLTPYRGTRYHLEDWRNGPSSPQNAREYFNLKHAKARNVIERAFGILKSRWAILRSPSFYPIKKQNLIILACALLHNFIRTQMAVDPFETVDMGGSSGFDVGNASTAELIESSSNWNMWRDELAAEMFQQSTGP